MRRSKRVSFTEERWAASLGTRAHTISKFYLKGFVASEPDPCHGPFVWVGSLTTGEITPESPGSRKTTIWIVPGLYDGPGGFSAPDASIKSHLGKIESAASRAIRKLTSAAPTEGAVVPPEIWQFLAWQAARTPGWMELVQRWANEPPFDAEHELVEPPPQGVGEISDRVRALCLEDPKTGTRREVVDAEEFDAYRKQGWKLVLHRDDHLEMMHLQAWYFQVRHFPRLSWVRLNAPEGEYFITSDRGVAWVVDGYADTPPAALRHPTAQVVAPLTKHVALIGRHGTSKLNVTPREVNLFVAFAASNWIAGPTKDVVEQSLTDRRAFQLRPGNI